MEVTKDKLEDWNKSTNAKSAIQDMGPETARHMASNAMPVKAGAITAVSASREKEQ